VDFKARAGIDRAAGQRFIGERWESREGELDIYFANRLLIADEVQKAVLIDEPHS
jgi:hypothetical protein